MLLALQQNLLLGTPPDLATVPDVVGETQAQATTDIQAVGFVVAVATDYSSSVAAGIVISQSPTGGSSAIVGSTVTITVSLGARADTGAGASQRKRRRYYVEIDGQAFPVADAAEASQLLQRARAIAERQAEAQSEKAVKVLTRKRKVPRVRIDAPVVATSPELKDDLAPLIADIQRLYAQAAVNAELRLRLAQIEKNEQDDEDDLLLLL